jgi:hypothetical protein
MQSFSLAPREMFASLWRNRYLIKTSVQREVVGRYRGSFLGTFWSFFHPMFMLAVYTFVFSVVFKARWQSGSGSKTEFALILFAGLMVFNLFAECINRAPSLILGHTSYVKKVVFPLEILPLVVIGGATFHLGISLAVWLLAYTLLFGMPHFTVLLLPVVLGPVLVAGLPGSVPARCLAVCQYSHHRHAFSLAYFLFDRQPARTFSDHFALQSPDAHHRADKGRPVLEPFAEPGETGLVLRLLHGHRLPGLRLVPEDAQGVRRCPLNPLSG